MAWVSAGLAREEGHVLVPIWWFHHTNAIHPWLAYLHQFAFAWWCRHIAIMILMPLWFVTDASEKQSLSVIKHLCEREREGEICQLGFCAFYGDRRCWSLSFSGAKTAIPLEMEGKSSANFSDHVVLCTVCIDCWRKSRSCHSIMLQSIRIELQVF